MKIKQVCEQTGLTDRTIRYYIEEGLISPYYTENYMGRRAYDFTETDVAMLENLATLRKFGFSLEQIRTIMQDPAEGRLMIDDLVRSKKAALKNDNSALQALEQLPYNTYTVAELADWLRLMNYKEKKPLQKMLQDEIDWDERIGRWFAWAFFIVLAILPVAYVIGTWVEHAYGARYAVVEGWGWLLLTLLPTLILLAVGSRMACALPAMGRKTMVWLAVLCLAMQPVSYRAAQEIFGISETTDFDHYMKLDDIWNVHRSEYFRLFPTYPGYGDRAYYYRYNQDLYLFDVYAEWTLEPEMLQEEIRRVEELFGSDTYGFHFGEDTIQRVETENFTCLFSVDPMRQTPDGEPSAPFRQMAKSHYFYVIFAWNEETGRVRYCLGNYFLGRVPCEPYYLSLEW